MSEKAKKASVPTVIVTVTQHSDGNVFVKGFPSHLGTALGVMFNAIVAVVSYFIDNARAGKLNDDGFVSESKIIQPKSNIIHPGGRA